MGARCSRQEDEDEDMVDKEMEGWAVVGEKGSWGDNDAAFFFGLGCSNIQNSP